MEKAKHSTVHASQPWLQTLLRQKFFTSFNFIWLGGIRLHIVVFLCVKQVSRAMVDHGTADLLKTGP